MEDQINFMLQALVNQRSVRGKTQSQHSVKNQMFASSLLRGHKQLGIQKSIAKTFLKRIVTPYGGIERPPLQKQGLLPMHYVPAYQT